MFVNIGGWAIGPNFHPLGLIVGSIIKKPGVVDDSIQIREYLYLTLDFDHESSTARLPPDLHKPWLT